MKASISYNHYGFNNFQTMYYEDRSTINKQRRQKWLYTTNLLPLEMIQQE